MPRPVSASRSQHAWQAIRALVVLFAMLLGFRSHKFKFSVPEEVACAVVEYLALLAGLVLGGPSFIIGAVAMKRMRRKQYRAVLLLLLLLLLTELFPAALKLIPRRVTNAEPSFFSVLSSLLE